MKNICTLLFVLAILTLPLVVNAQILPPPPPGPTAVPLDPLSWVLLGAGGVAAGKKYYDYRKQKDLKD